MIDTSKKLKAKFPQAVIDYLRTHRNLKGFRRHSEFKNTPVANSYEQGEFDRFISNDSGDDVGSRIDFDRLIGMSRHWERAVMILYFREELNETQIANLFGVSPSRISQWLKRIQKRIQARVNQTESNLRRKVEKRPEGILPEEAERIRQEVEQSTFKTMAIEESLQMESFNEASF